MDEQGRALDPATVQALRVRIDAFLGGHTTMSLATTGSDGSPSVAAVFYAHDQNLNLYFLSENGTAHVRNFVARPRCAGAIHTDLQEWQRIKGLQLRGNVAQVPVARSARVARLYGRKFPFIGPLLEGKIGPDMLVGPLARARFFVFTPEWVRLIDNTVRFGFKEELLLDSNASAGTGDNEAMEQEAC